MPIRRFAFFAALCGTCSVYAGDWLTFGADAQRTGWAQKESDITPENAKSLGLLWKIPLDNQAKELNSLTAPVAAEWVVTDKGMKEIVVVGGASDSLFAVDAESGKLLWKKTFQVEAKPRQTPFWLCPNSLNATPLLAKGGLSVTVYAIASDGKLHGLSAINGEDIIPPTQFVPAYSKNWSLNLYKDVLYTTTSQGCGGAKSGVWAMDLKSPERKVTFLQASTNAAGIWGRAGAAIGKSGMVYAQTGDGTYDAATGKLPDTILAVSPDMKLADYFTPSNHSYLTRKDLDAGSMSPVVFSFKGKEIVASAGKEGVISLLDAKNIGGPDHKTPLFRGALVANEDADFAGRGFWGAFATWEDGQGTRWLYAPASGPVASKAPAFEHTNGPAPDGSIMAFKVDEKDGKPVLVPAWVSRDMNLPEPPIIANGVVFAISNGEFARQWRTEGSGLYSSKERAEKHTGNTVLYAFDAATGKELFSSGNTMPSFTHFSGIAISGGKIFVTTYDSTLYAFGLKE